MRKKLILKVVLLGVAVMGTAFVLLASNTDSKSESCPEQESMENCSKKVETSGGGMIWENMSRQFFSSF